MNGDLTKAKLRAANKYSHRGFNSIMFKKNKTSLQNLIRYVLSSPMFLKTLLFKINHSL